MRVRTAKSLPTGAALRRRAYDSERRRPRRIGASCGVRRRRKRQRSPPLAGRRRASDVAAAEHVAGTRRSKHPQSGCLLASAEHSPTCSVAAAPRTTGYMLPSRSALVSRRRPRDWAGMRSTRELDSQAYGWLPQALPLGTVVCAVRMLFGKYRLAVGIGKVLLAGRLFGQMALLGKLSGCPALNNGPTPRYSLLGYAPLLLSYRVQQRCLGWLFASGHSVGHELSLLCLA